MPPDGAGHFRAADDFHPTKYRGRPVFSSVGTEKMFESRKAICARHADIGMDKVLTLKQQRFVHRFRQCVSETIAEIQAGPMPSPPEVVVGLARQSALLQSDGFNDDGSGT